MMMGPTANDPVPAADGGPITEASIRALITESASNRRSVDALADAIGRNSRAHFWTRIVGAVLVGVAAFTIVDNRMQINELRAQFCPVVATFIPGPGDPVPQPGPDGDRGRLVIKEMRGLSDRFDC